MHAAGFPDWAKRRHEDVSRKRVSGRVVSGDGVGHHGLRGTAQQVQGGSIGARSRRGGDDATENGVL